jgi:lipopolysaccharide transport system permease protein
MFLGINLNISANIFFIFFLIPLLAFLGLGIGIIISSFTIKYRDLSILLSFAVQLLMYATPVVYPLSAVNDLDLRAYISLNPLTHILEAYRYILFNTGDLNILGLCYSISVMCVLLFFGIILFNKVERTCMDIV